MKLLNSAFYGLALIILVFINVQCKGERKEEKKDSISTEINSEKTGTVSISRAFYGTTLEGKTVDIYTLKNKKGMSVDIITYGGIITSWTAPDNNGVYQDIVLGYDSLDEYIKSSPYFGAIIGRYGNRIAKATFSLDGTEYKLAQNNGPNHLHGGNKGFDKVVWNAAEIKGDNFASLELTYLSKDMEEGYPGNLTSIVTYTLSENNILEVLYDATTDKRTIVNLTQHSYFNLSGDLSKQILDHEVTINADKFIPVDASLIPTGELTDVTDTPFDLRTPKTIGAEINGENDQLKKGGGYDHCWVLNNQNNGVRAVAAAYHPESGRYLEIFSDEPGIQFYTGNFLDGTLPKKGGGTYGYRTGFCLETQHYPDSPNQKDFPSTILNPGERYISRTSFKFSVK